MIDESGTVMVWTSLLPFYKKMAFVFLVFCLYAGIPAYGDPSLPVPEEIPDIFFVESLTESLSGEIMGKPDSGELGEVRLRVFSTYPGWLLNVQGFALLNLNDENKLIDNIAASEQRLEMVPEVGDPIYLNSLRGSRPLIELGEPGETEYCFKVSVKTNDFHQHGTYSGNIVFQYKHANDIDDNQWGTLKIPVRVKVRCEVKHSYKNNKIYFHVGNPLKDVNMDATVSGSLHSDVPLILSLSVRGWQDSINNLRFQKKLFEQQSTKHVNSIPIQWELKENGGNYRGPEESSNSSVSWQLNETPGDMNYQLKCVMKPEKYQAPGTYGLSAVVSIAPRL